MTVRHFSNRNSYSYSNGNIRVTRFSVPGFHIASPEECLMSACEPEIRQTQIRLRRQRYVRTLPFPSGYHHDRGIFLPRHFCSWRQHPKPSLKRVVYMFLTGRSGSDARDCTRIPRPSRFLERINHRRRNMRINYYVL